MTIRAFRLNLAKLMQQLVPDLYQYVLIFLSWCVHLIFLTWHDITTYIVVQFCFWFNLDFPLFDIHYHILA